MPPGIKRTFAVTIDLLFKLRQILRVLAMVVRFSIRLQLETILILFCVCSTLILCLLIRGEGLPVLSHQLRFVSEGDFLVFQSPSNLYSSLSISQVERAGRAWKFEGTLLLEKRT